MINGTITRCIVIIYGDPQNGVTIINTTSKKCITFINVANIYCRHSKKSVLSGSGSAMVWIKPPPNTMYKRPTPRVRGSAPQHFVSEAQPGGGVRSQWASYTSRARVPSGTPGVAGALIDKLRNPHPVHQPKVAQWVPSREYEYLAAHMSEAERGPWLEKCRDWFAAHAKPPPPHARAPAPAIDYQRIAAMYSVAPRTAGGAVKPPIAERVKVYRAAGCAEAFIAKAVARDAHLEATADERQEALDAIFAKWPAASKAAKVKAKAKPKVIKAVKKKL